MEGKELQGHNGQERRELLIGPRNLYYRTYVTGYQVIPIGTDCNKGSVPGLGFLYVRKRLLVNGIPGG